MGCAVVRAWGGRPAGTRDCWEREGCAGPRWRDEVGCGPARSGGGQPVTATWPGLGCGLGAVRSPGLSPCWCLSPGVTGRDVPGAPGLCVGAGRVPVGGLPVGGLPVGGGGVPTPQLTVATVTVIAVPVAGLLEVGAPEPLVRVGAVLVVTVMTPAVPCP